MKEHVALDTHFIEDTSATHLGGLQTCRFAPAMTNDLINK